MKPQPKRATTLRTKGIVGWGWLWNQGGKILLEKTWKKQWPLVEGHSLRQPHREGTKEVSILTSFSSLLLSLSLFFFFSRCRPDVAIFFLVTCLGLVIFALFLYYIWFWKEISASLLTPPSFPTTPRTLLNIHSWPTKIILMWKKKKLAPEGLKVNAIYWLFF